MPPGAQVPGRNGTIHAAPRIGGAMTNQSPRHGSIARVTSTRVTSKGNVIPLGDAALQVLLSENSIERAAW